MRDDKSFRDSGKGSIYTLATYLKDKQKKKCRYAQTLFKSKFFCIHSLDIEQIITAVTTKQQPAKRKVRKRRENEEFQWRA